MYYNEVSKFKNKVVHRPSPTYSVESHDKWSSRYIWALDSLHEIYYPSHFITFKLGVERSDEVEKFKRKLRQSISNKKCREKEFNTAYFGVFEILKDCSVHIHVLVRNYSKDHLDEFISRYNKKNAKSYSLEYSEPVKTPDGASRYSFKLGFNTKILFRKKSLRRYTITGGGYFPKGIRFYQEIGRKKYFANKNGVTNKI